MDAPGRPPLRDRLLGAGPETRLTAALALLVLVCGGFFALRAVDAVSDAYRWNGEAEAEAIAHSFVRTLDPRDVHDIERLRDRVQRLSGAHPQLLGAAARPARPDTPHVGQYERRDQTAILRFPIIDGRGRPIAVLRLDFELDERAAALAAGRREVLLAGLGAGVLFVLGAALLARTLMLRPFEHRARVAQGRLAALQERLDGLALHDPLTGVLNHRGLHDTLHDALSHGARRNRKVAVVVLDIDDFDDVNDRNGHAAGDHALRLAAHVLMDELRPGDLCGRIGGDEFLLALPDTDAWGAERVVERLREAVAAAPLVDGRPGLAFSAGISEFPRDARDQQDLIRLANGALYRAKRSGRNRCVVYSSFVDSPLSPQEEAERARSAGLANTVYALARAVDLKDGYTHQHSARVAQYAAVLARDIGMTEEEIEKIRTAGILHDVGKVGVADAVLLKPAHLTEQEFLEMQRHSALGRDIVEGAGMPEIGDWVLHLHERWDGKGYPYGLEGEDIPPASRVLAVADAFEAMTSSRLYRRGMPVEKALDELEASAGAQFDPDVARRMVELVRAGAFPLGEIGVLAVTHYGSAAGRADSSEASARSSSAS